MIDWFNFYISLFVLIAGIILSILSGKKRYILWVKERMPMSEEKIERMEKGGAIGLIIFAVLSLLRELLKH